MKHTPGPWHFYGPDNLGKTCGFGVRHGGSEGPNLIAYCWSEGGPDIEAAQEANAHLIAAAPELLSALQDLSEVCGEATCLQAANLEVPNSVWRHMIALNAVAVQVIKKAKRET